MSKHFKYSFRKRLAVSFLAVSLIPLLICSGMLSQVFKLTVNENEKKEAEEQLLGISDTLSLVSEEFKSVCSNITEKRLIIRELTKENKKDTLVYKELFALTNKMRNFACFDIYDSEGIHRYSTGNFSSPEDKPTDWGILSASQKSSDSIAFLSQDNYNQQGKALVEGALCMRDKDDEVLGYLVMTIDDKGFEKILSGRHYQQNELIILNKYWRPVYSSLNSTGEDELKEMRSLLIEGKSFESLEKDFSYTCLYHPQMSLFLLLKRPTALAAKMLKILYAVTLVTALFCIAVSVLLSIRLSRRNSKPIEELHKAIDEVGNNNLDVTVDADFDDELGQLAFKFNKMVSALKVNQEHLVENQKELNEAQIRMLQAQLNPHFLCNTLDTMKWISKINKVPQVALMSTNLADILRFCISPQEFVPLSREVEVLESYIEIQKIRLSDDFSLRIDIPEELEFCLVPKMILQPIVENAIIHGLEGVENGEITVCANVENNDRLIIKVEDNGSGLPDDMVGTYCHKDKDKLKGHLGLYNVDTILVKYYGEGFGLYLENKEDHKGAIVKAALPLCREEDS